MPLRQRRAVSRGRNGNLQVAAIHDGRIVEIAIVRIVDRVDEHAADPRLLVLRARDILRHRRDHERYAVEIARIELRADARRSLPSCGELPNRRRRRPARRPSRRTCGQQSGDFGLAHGTSPHKKDPPSLQLHENGK